MFRVFSLVFTAFLASCVSIAPAMAEVVYNPDNLSLYISGRTTEQQFISAYEVFREEPVEVVHLQGEGGVLDYGVSIGKMIALSGAKVVIPEGQVCASACAIAALGSNRVEALGLLLFHRPYVGNMPSDVILDDVVGFLFNDILHTQEYLLAVGVPYEFLQFLIVHTNRCTYAALSHPEAASLIKYGMEAGAYNWYGDIFVKLDRCQ